jgi:hypothetical protein
MRRPKCTSRTHAQAQGIVRSLSVDNPTHYRIPAHTQMTLDRLFAISDRSDEDKNSVHTFAVFYSFLGRQQHFNRFD